ncbi:MAG: hypothetical protein NZO58_14115, partial [Gemmataceae bacterium]|nr:hypothetical protein [Gemmataceae bacterium]
LRGDLGWWLTLLLVTLLGALHALTPGHGKTLVAAYLIGQRGTAWHAVVLGIITTLTHTGAILLLAAVLFFLPNELHERFQRWVVHGLGLSAGVVIVCLGFWLLLQRLGSRSHRQHRHEHATSGSAGAAAGHSHSHGFFSHSHAFAPDDASPGGVRWGSLIVMGITGGLIPCGDAVGVFLYYVLHGDLWMVLPALICFSLGLASVLVLVGVLVVRVPGFAESRLGQGRIVQALPTLSALIIILMGLWMCYTGSVR